MTQHRRLATIMFTDVVGYTAAMERDERHARALVARAHEHARAFVERCGGQWLETVGDGSLSAFASASQAVDCALAIQDSLASDPELQLRIGLHVGDVVFADDGVYGDGVNVASRVHALAPPGGTVVTEAIRSAIRGHANLDFTSLGRKRLKNVGEPVAVYRLNAGTSGPASWLGTAGSRTAMVAVVLMIGLGGLAVFLATGEQEWSSIESDEPRRIVVLPFEYGEGKSDKHLADGLTEELINALAQLKELRVTARTSAFHFEDKAVPVAEIADRLGVDYVVEGMVRRSGEDLRISAQLIQADEDFHMWSHIYDRQLADIFEVQQDIAEKVAISLEVVLDEEKQRRMRAVGVDNVEAFLAFQKGVDFIRTAHESGSSKLLPMLKDANGWFDDAIALAPDFSEAYRYRADLYWHLTIAVVQNRAIPSSLSESAVRANELLKSNLDSAYKFAKSRGRRAAIDLFRTVVFGDWSMLPKKLEALIGSEECIRSDIMGLLPSIGMSKQVRQMATRLTECDPMNFYNWPILVRSELWDGNPETALAVAEEGLELAPHGTLRAQQMVALLALRDFERASLEVQGFFSKFMLYAANGELSRAADVHRQYIEKNGADYSFYMAAWSGNVDETNALASKYDEHELGHTALLAKIAWCYCGAPFDLDATPNFKERIEQSGLPWPPPSPIDFPAKDW